MTKLTEKQAAMVTRIGRVGSSTNGTVPTPGEQSTLRSLDKRGLILRQPYGTDVEYALTDEGEKAYYELNPDETPEPTVAPQGEPVACPDEVAADWFEQAPGTVLATIDGVHVQANAKNGMVIQSSDRDRLDDLVEAGKLEKEQHYSWYSGLSQTEYFLPGAEYRGYETVAETPSGEPKTEVEPTPGPTGEVEYDDNTSIDQEACIDCGGPVDPSLMSCDECDKEHDGPTTIATAGATPGPTGEVAEICVDGPRWIYEIVDIRKWFSMDASGRNTYSHAIELTPEEAEAYGLRLIGHKPAPKAPRMVHCPPGRIGPARGESR